MRSVGHATSINRPSKRENIVHNFVQKTNETARCRELAVLDGLDDLLQTLLCVGEEHHGLFGVVEEGVVDTCEAGA